MNGFTLFLVISLYLSIGLGIAVLFTWLDVTDGDGAEIITIFCWPVCLAIVAIVGVSCWLTEKVFMPIHEIGERARKQKNESAEKCPGVLRKPDDPPIHCIDCEYDQHCFAQQYFEERGYGIDKRTFFCWNATRREEQDDEK